MTESKSSASSSIEQMFTLILTTQKALTFVSPDLPMLAITSAISNRKNAGKDYQLLESMLKEVFPSGVPENYMDKEQREKNVQNLLKVSKSING